MSGFDLPGGEFTSAALRRAEAENERLRAELESARESLDARTRALVRARAGIGSLIAMATSRHGTTLCPRCGEALTAEVDAENAGEAP